MIRYVGQLYSLYWHAWGLFFPLVLLLLSTVGLTAALAAVRFADARWRLGLGLAYPRRKLKNEV
jgi:hypothetical protein